ncbi:MAG: GYF domain-containing protein [Verrucomicrobiota bacterium]
MDNEPIWYLKKHDDEDAVFGPIGIENLRNWATAAKISPLDRVSCDGQRTWERAPMVPELYMDYLVEVNDDFVYGPTTLGAIQEFIANDEITSDTIVINCREGTAAPVKENPLFTNTPSKMIGLSSSEMARPTAATVLAPTNGGHLSQSLQERIRDLELQVLEKNRHIEMLESQYHDLREKYVTATGGDPYKS